MSRKSKGINAERELIHLFWKFGWAAIRIAGSGSSRYPSPDILAGNNLKKIAIECKTTVDSRKYLTRKEVYELEEFSRLFGAEPWIAVKFSKFSWFFLSLDDLEERENSYLVSLETAKRRGLSFDDIVR